MCKRYFAYSEPAAFILLFQSQTSSGLIKIKKSMTKKEEDLKEALSNFLSHLPMESFKNSV